MGHLRLDAGADPDYLAFLAVIDDLRQTTALLPLREMAPDLSRIGSRWRSTSTARCRPFHAGFGAARRLVHGQRIGDAPTSALLRRAHLVTRSRSASAPLRTRRLLALAHPGAPRI
jgi:hypothetical protein